MFVSKHNCVFKIGQTKRAGTSGDIVRQACSLVEIWSTVHDADDELGPFLDHEPWKDGENPEKIAPGQAA